MPYNKDSTAPDDVGSYYQSGAVSFGSGDYYEAAKNFNIVLLVCDRILEVRPDLGEGRSYSADGYEIRYEHEDKNMVKKTITVKMLGKY